MEGREGSQGVLEKWTVPMAEGGALAVVVQWEELEEHTERMKRGPHGVRSHLERAWAWVQTVVATVVARALG